MKVIVHFSSMFNAKSVLELVEKQWHRFHPTAVAIRQGLETARSEQRKIAAKRKAVAAR